VCRRITHSIGPTTLPMTDRRLVELTHQVAPVQLDEDQIVAVALRDRSARTSSTRGNAVVRKTCPRRKVAHDASGEPYAHATPPLLEPQPV
jgi:hypothetical protein